MVAKHVVLPVRHGYRRVAGSVAVGSRHVRLAELRTVDPDAALSNLDDVPRQPDDSFDVGSRRIFRELEHDHVTALDAINAVEELVHEDPLVVRELRQHACPFDPHRLAEEDDHNRGDGKRDQEVAGPKPDLLPYGAGRCHVKRIGSADSAGVGFHVWLDGGAAAQFRPLPY